MHSSPATTTSEPQWTPTSWKLKHINQGVVYTDAAALANSLSRLSKLPPLVSHVEIDRLKIQLKEVALNRRFLLQGGDCAELFDYCSQTPIENKLKVLLQMSLILVWGGRVQPVRIARMAGQYAKPRSKPTEIVDGKEYTAFRGDNVNGNDLSQRDPNPQRLVDAYFHSAATINYVRATLANGFADLRRVHGWDLDQVSLDHVRSPAVKKEYQEIVDRLLDSLDFMRTIGADEGADAGTMGTVDMFMSHEGLLLDYETQLTRKVGENWYNLGSHFLWIGDRTRQLDGICIYLIYNATGAHIEYFRGIKNPIGLKVGPTMEPDELIRALDILNPDFEVGKITLITRYGAKNIAKHLPSHIRAVQSTKHIVVWCSDPMHGNTEISQTTNLKTRRFENIVEELASGFRIHKECNSFLNGVHCELTGEPVTEVVGGSSLLSEQELERNYQTSCDPRLNYEQSLDIAFVIAKHFEKERADSVAKYLL